MRPVNVAVLAIVAGLSVFRQPAHGEDHLLIAVHRSAGVNCGECHQEKPPSRAPSSSTCIGCHGDQQSIANKTENASPNPHAPPHARLARLKTAQNVIMFIGPRKSHARAVIANSFSMSNSPN
ncbi:MAG: cytochrome c3 family protein [Bradyrhizobium sp.]|nr:cytochrome c3 family protein [Pseudomonadota bacterium]MDE2469124.1 cytochrome c3 family protein [Bradyrhizobium sp.]